MLWRPTKTGSVLIYLCRFAKLMVVLRAKVSDERRNQEALLNTWTTNVKSVLHELGLLTFGCLTEYR